jgi:alpha-galactosidase
MNRDLPVPMYQQGELVRELMGDIARDHGVEVEACASGGGRCDWGVMAVCARAWISDQNDALDRLRINRGASHFLPLRVMGTHVGPHRSHITGRRLGLDLRAHVALFGWFGVEADITRWTDEERTRLAAHIANYKRLRALIHEGDYWRLETHEPDHLADAVTAADGSHALLRAVRTGSSRLGQGTGVRLPGLDPDARYTVSALHPMDASAEAGLAPAIAKGTLALPGRVLMAHGLDLWIPRPETSLVLEIVRT